MNNSIRNWQAMREQSRKQAKRQARIERVIGWAFVGLVVSLVMIEPLIDIIIR